jgi:5-methylcytosine-specific restriction protein B
MQTDKRLFSRFTKNDFGQGGAWDFYWGAFYQKGGKRTASAQLSMWINEEVLEFGSYIGDYGTKQRERFARNCRQYYEALLPIFEVLLSDDRILYGARETWLAGVDDTFSSKFTLQEFLKNPAQANFDVSLVLSRNNVLELDGASLRDLVLTTYSQVFPLVLLALEDEPMPSIREFLDLADVLDEIEPEAEPELTPAYPLSQLSAETGHTEDKLGGWIQAIERKGQAIFYGPPGTGKTYLAERLARHLTAESDGLVELVQFHPAYAYEDFIQGIRPQTGDDGRLTYPMKAGRFLDFCQRAANRDGRCVLIIDEINRANLSRVFGELMYLLEYRDRRIPLSGGGTFRIPGNVRLIGTMNTADRSIALVDHALRRRFAFIHLAPNYDILRHYHRETGFPIERLIPILIRLNNNYISDVHYEIGHTFFLRGDLSAELPDIWQMEIEPYLEEYFFDRPQVIETFRWENIKQELS